MKTHIEEIFSVSAQVVKAIPHMLNPGILIAIVMLLTIQFLNGG
jgi:hypothetical protein